MASGVDDLLMASGGAGEKGDDAFGPDARVRHACSSVAAYVSAILGSPLAATSFASVLSAVGGCVAGGCVAGALFGAVDSASDVDVWVPAEGVALVLAHMETMRAACAPSVVTTPPPATRTDADATNASAALLRDSNAYSLLLSERAPVGRLARWATSCTTFTLPGGFFDVIALRKGVTPANTVACFDLMCVQTAAIPITGADNRWRVEGPGVPAALMRVSGWGPAALVELQSLPRVAAREWVRTLSRSVKYSTRGVAIDYSGLMSAFQLWMNTSSTYGSTTRAAVRALASARAAMRALYDADAALHSDALSAAAELSVSRPTVCALAVAIALRESAAASLVAALPEASSEPLVSTRVYLLSLAARSGARLETAALALLDADGASASAAALVGALRCKCVTLAERIVTAGAPIAGLRVRLPFGALVSALGAAARLSRDKGAGLVSALLLRGAHVDVALQGSDGSSPLKDAAAAASPITVRALLAAGAPIPRGMQGDALLAAAIGFPRAGEGGEEEEGKEELEGGEADMTVAEDYAARAEVLAALLAAGVAAGGSVITPRTALHAAAARGWGAQFLSILRSIPPSERAVHAAVVDADGCTLRSVLCRIRSGHHIVAEFDALCAAPSASPPSVDLLPPEEQPKRIAASELSVFDGGGGDDDDNDGDALTSRMQHLALIDCEGSEVMPATPPEQDMAFDVWHRNSAVAQALPWVYDEALPHAPHEHPWRRHVYEVLEQIHSSLHLSAAAADVLLAQLDALFDYIVAEVLTLCRSRGRRIISSREIQTAVRLVLPGNLAKHAVSEGVKAIVKFTSSWGSGPPPPHSHKGLRVVEDRSSEVAGLQFSGQSVLRALHVATAQLCSANAPIYLAAVLEYITAEIVELAGRAAQVLTPRGDDDISITPQAIEKGIRDDKDLVCLMSRLARHIRTPVCDGRTDAELASALLVGASAAKALISQTTAPGFKPTVTPLTSLPRGGLVDTDDVSFGALCFSASDETSFARDHMEAALLTAISTSVPPFTARLAAVLAHSNLVGVACAAYMDAVFVHQEAACSAWETRCDEGNTAGGPQTAGLLMPCAKCFQESEKRLSDQWWTLRVALVAPAALRSFVAAVGEEATRALAAASSAKMADKAGDGETAAGSDASVVADVDATIVVPPAAPTAATRLFNLLKADALKRAEAHAA